MKEIEYFHHRDELIGLCVRGSHRWDRTEFLTPDGFYQQLGLLAYDGDERVRPHAHHRVPRTVDATMEVLFCVSGRIEYTFYDAENDWKEICRCLLEPGDTLCLFGAGHGGRALEPTRLIEVKQGPFLGARDKYYYPE
jgi:hypothetical protein